MSKKDNSIFSWDTDDFSKIFPIDYSVRELAKHSKRDARGFKRNLLAHPLLQDTLTGLRSAKKPTEKSGKKGPAGIIPLEAVSFLSCFYQLVTSKHYHHDYCSTVGIARLISKKTSSEVILKFTRDFCRLIDEETDTEKTTKDELDSTAAKVQQLEHGFCRHIAFQDKVFNQTLLDVMWENEFMPRYNQIRQIANSVSFKCQSQILQNCLIQLDQAILDFEVISAQSRKDNPPETSSIDLRIFPQLLLEKLLFKRKQSRYSKAGDYTYVVNNARIDDSMDLEKAFYQLASPVQSDRGLLNRARHCYLQCLTASRKASDDDSASTFEQEYQKLKKYLAMPSLFAHKPEDEQKTFVLERCKQYCRLTSDICTLGTDLPQFESQNSTETSYERDFLEYLIYSDMNTYLTGFRKANDFSTFLRASSFPLRQKQFVQNVSVEIPLISDSATKISKKITDTFVAIVRIHSKYSALNGILKFDNTGCFAGNLCEASNILQRLGSEAMSFWDIAELQMLYTQGHIREMLSCYNDCKKNSKPLWYIGIDKSYGFLDAMYQLLKVILLISLKKAVEDSVPGILQQAKMFCKTASYYSEKG